MSSKKEAQAACILADMFSASVLPALEFEKRTWLYGWEEDALKWLRKWRKRDKKTSIVMWTAYYMEFGPPPWESKGLKL